MPTTIECPATERRAPRRVTPSRVDPATAKPFTLEQELEPFGSWVGEPRWVPPKDSSPAMAETMLRESRPFTSKAKRWSSVVNKHRSEFTQVREIDLLKASIRLPQGRFFVSVIEQQHFDTITDTVPACVQTRLEEFLAGPGKQPGVKVYYLKPLCVEVDDKLILTDREDIAAATKKIQDEVFAEYRRLALVERPKAAVVGAANLALAVPRGVVNYLVQRRQKAIDAYQARLEFKRRKTALRAANLHRKCRTDGCSFDEMLALTNPLQRDDVIEQYGIEHELSRAKRDALKMIAAGAVPWFIAMSFGGSSIYSLTLALVLNPVPPLVVCDPAFVAEMPGSHGTVLKIGHFDDVGGVTHVEI